MTAKLALLGLAAAVGSAAAADYFDEDAGDIVVLDTEAFGSKVMESDEMWLVEFFAPWCGHCQKLAPEWRDAATRLKKSAKLGAVDCTGDDKEICSKYGVRGFPSIKVFVKDKDKEPTDYKGARDADGIESFVTGEASKEAAGSIGSKLVPAVMYTEMHEFLTDSKKPRVLLFPEEKDAKEDGSFNGFKSVPSWFKMTASSFKKEVEEEVTSYKQGKAIVNKKKKVVQMVEFGAAADEEAKKIAKKFKVEDTPKVFLVFAGHYTSYDGEFNKEELKEFLEEYAEMEIPEADELPEEDWTKLPTFPEKPTPKKKVAVQAVKKINSERLYSTCLKGTSCILMLSATGTPEGTHGEGELMASLAAKYKHDKLNFAWVDAVEQDEFAAQLGVEALPALVSIKGKRDKKMKAANLPMGEGGLTEGANWVDKVLGGDVRFKVMKELDMKEDYLLKMDAGSDEDAGGDEEDL